VKVKAVLEQLQRISDGIGVECTASQRVAVAVHGESSGTQKRERPPLETVTAGLMKRQHTEKTKCTL
jgi:hypothetical protein